MDPYQPTPVEIGRRNRIRLSVAAYAYEIFDESVMPDPEYDRLCTLVRPEMSTGNRKMDTFFRTHFDPSTGMWVHKHPEKSKLHALYLAHYKGK